jgi:hypothetical protein
MICNVDKEYIMKLIESSSSPQLTTAHKSGNSSDKFLSKLKNSVDSVLKRLSLNNKSQYVLFEPKNYDGVEYKDDEDMPKSESSNSLDEQINNDGVEYKDDTYVNFITSQSIGSFSGTRSLSSVGSEDSISSFNSKHTPEDIFPVGQTILGTL